MSSSTRILSHLVAIVAALAANACSVAGARPLTGVARAVTSCAGGSVQSAADAAVYSECDSVQGNLRIAAPDLTDLSALRRLKSVSGTLEIAENGQLDDLSGLEGLRQVGALVVRDNPELDDLDGLENVRHAGSVTIRGNAELATLHGLEGLTRTEKLTIERNGLYQTSGVSHLVDVGDLVVTDNAKLNSLQGFRSLRHARSVEISGNPRLCARGMLPKLERVDAQLSVHQNRGLSKPELRSLLGRVEQGAPSPSREVVEPNRQASL